jgi:tRNA threonylcarbamoyladenosine biosynthesis protein TsaE
LKLSYSLQNIDDIATKLLQQFDSKIILFDGDMGTGKTTLIKAFVKALGGNSTHVTSPTFSLVNEYEIQDDLVYHFDFYRITNEEEALNIGFEEYCYSNHWVLIEWPKKIKKFLPINVNTVYLARKDTDFRSLTLKKSKI